MMRWMLLLTALLASVTTEPSAAQERNYELRYELELVPDSGEARVAIRLGEGARHLREARFRIDPDRYSEFGGDGSITVDGEYVTWDPPREGGVLRYRVAIDQLRDDGEYDARMTPEWAIFRGDDVFPPARVRITRGAEADATLEVKLPRGWSMRAPYREIKDNRYQIVSDGRSFDRPVGWMVAGEIGVRLERIDEMRVAVAGPRDQDARRMDILAFLNWNLPWLRALLPGMPDRLLVVTAGDPMWRGGLSGPRSMYLHTDRPMISGNGTSTLLHELVHVASSLDSEEEEDWIVEGLAEYYAVELLRRSGTITERRFEHSMHDLADWGSETSKLRRRHSTGATTARAATIMHALDREIRSATDETASLDDVFRRLVASEKPVNLERLRAIAAEVAGGPLHALADDQLPGIDTPQDEETDS